MPVKSHYKKGKTTSGSSADAVVPQFIKEVQWIFFSRNIGTRKLIAACKSNTPRISIYCASAVQPGTGLLVTNIARLLLTIFFLPFCLQNKHFEILNIGKHPIGKSEWVYKNWTSRLSKIIFLGGFAEEFFVILQHILNLFWIQVNSYWFATSCHLVIHSILRYL